MSMNDMPVLILEFVGTVVVPATSGRFIAKDKFVVDTSDDALVKISTIFDNFTKWFLSGDGKIEEYLGEQTLRYHKFRKSSLDGPIIAELGGEEKAETTLSEMFSLMEKQGKGEDGVLLKNGRANIFYIRDQNGELRAVYVAWLADDGWFVFARPVEYQSEWGGGLLVFSRNSLQSLEPSAPAQA